MQKRHRSRLEISGSTRRTFTIENRRWVGIVALAIVFTLSRTAAWAQKADRIGVVTAGGAWYQVIDGLRVGLKQLALIEGKHFALAIRDTKGNAAAAEEAAKSLEREKLACFIRLKPQSPLQRRRRQQTSPSFFVPVPIRLNSGWWPASQNRAADSQAFSIETPISR